MDYQGCQVAQASVQLQVAALVLTYDAHGHSRPGDMPQAPQPRFREGHKATVGVDATLNLHHDPMEGRRTLLLCIAQIAPDVMQRYNSYCLPWMRP